MDETIAARFCGYVSKSDGCCEWPAYRLWTGYGRFKSGGLQHRAHRFAWVLTHGEPPPGMLVCHRCDNPACVRPDHLFLGTHADNARDMVSKGRAPKGSGRVGSQCVTSKLTEAIVLQARVEHAQGITYQELAEKYGVARDTIRDAVRGFTWKHVTASPSSENSGGK